MVLVSCCFHGRTIYVNFTMTHNLLCFLYPAISDEYEALKKLADDRLTSLNDLLQGRKQFEADIDGCQHWLNEAEVATSAEIRAPNVGLLEEQLSKVMLLSYVHG